MNTTMAEIEANARKLPAAERERLAQKLMESVHNQGLNEIDIAWMAVAEQRFLDYRNGKDSGVPESDFFSQVERELGWM